MVNPALVLGFLCASLPAQTSDVFKAEIPFSLTVDDRTFEPGEYFFSGSSSHRGLIFRTDGRQFVVPAFRASSVDGANGPELVFNRYEDLYFLSKVSLGPGLGTLKLSACRMEREMVLTTWKLERVVP